MPDPDPDPLYRILEDAIDTALARWEDPAFAAIWQGGHGVWTRDDLPDLLGIPTHLPVFPDGRMRLAELAMSAAAEIRTGTRIFG